MSTVRRLRKPVAGLLAPLLLPLLAGCYSYSPVETSRPDAGSDVRLHLTPDGREAVNRQTRRTVAESVDGKVIRSGQRTVTLSVPQPERRGYEEFGSARDTVRIPYSAVTQVETEDLRLIPTVALTGGAVAGFFFGFQAVFEGGGGGGGPGPPGSGPVSVGGNQ